MSLDVLNQIAQEAGVSRWTVSRVLRGETVYVRPHAARRAEQIRESAARLGYRPNAAAQAVGRGRFDTLALLSNADEAEYLSPQMLFALQNAASARRQHLVLERLPSRELDRPDAVPQVLRRASCDAVLFHAVGPLPERYEQVVTQYRLPVVWLNAKRPTDCVYFDDLAAARQATDHLIALGHRRIALLSTPADETSHYSLDDRRDGYAEAMAGAELKPRGIELPVGAVHGHDPRPADLLDPVLTGPDRPTAILTVERDLAGFAYVSALRVGLSVPRDLSLIGFGERMSNATGVRIGICRLPEADLGRRAVDLALRKVESPDDALPPEALPAALELHDTVAPPPSR